MAAKEMSVQKRAAILLAILALFVALDILPTPDGLTLEGKRSLALILCTTLIWISNVLPLGLVAMGALLLMPVLKLCTLPQAADKFCEPVFFFMVANYVVANGLAVTGLDRRITLLLAIASKGNAKKLLFIFMMGAAILSMVLSDMGVVLMMLPIALMLLRATGCEPGKSNYGRAIMVGLPVAALIGGMGTPAGSATNVLSGRWSFSPFSTCRTWPPTRRAACPTAPSGGWRSSGLWPPTPPSCCWMSRLRA